CVPSLRSMRPRSSGRAVPATHAFAARTGWGGTRRLPASKLPVPPGTTPSATSVPTNAAAACIVVPSPPNTVTTSNRSATACSARRRASPGPTVAANSTFQPPRSSVSTTARTATSSVRAAAGLVMSSTRVTSIVQGPQRVQTDLIALSILRLIESVDGTGRGRLDGQLEAKRPVEPVLRTGVESRPAGADIGQQSEIPLPANLPAGGDLRHLRSAAARRRHRPAGNGARPDIEVVDGDHQVADQRPLGFAG